MCVYLCTYTCVCDSESLKSLKVGITFRYSHLI